LASKSGFYNLLTQAMNLVRKVYIHLTFWANNGFNKRNLKRRHNLSSLYLL